MHALFFGSQHDGQIWPCVYFGDSPGLQKPSWAKQSHSWSLVWAKFLPGQHAASGHLHGTVSQPGQILSQRPVVMGLAGASQKPTAATHMQALFSGGQQSGHCLPGVNFGFWPALQKPSWAKQSQEWSLVALKPWPGQQPVSHLHVGESQPGQMLEQIDFVGSGVGAQAGSGVAVAAAAERQSAASRLAVEEDGMLLDGWLAGSGFGSQWAEVVAVAVVGATIDHAYYKFSII
eukprot:SAG22_NODE_1910_length_3328_cov_2.639827_1_plen_233_part_00